MKLINTTDYSDTFLRRMVSWCCKELGLPVRRVWSVKFRNKSCGMSGHCAIETGRIVCSVSKGYPIDSLVDLVAHELAHRLLHLHRVRTRVSRRWGTVSSGGSEHQAQWHANRVVEAFRIAQDALVAEWSAEPEKPVKSALSVQERRQQAVLAKLSAWQRKLKTARTKVAKYQKQARYYEKAIAAKRSR